MKPTRKVAAGSIVALMVCSTALARTRTATAVKPCDTATALIEHEEKFFILTGATLARVDIATSVVEARKDLHKVGKEPGADERDRKWRQAFLARYDSDGDGVISSVEAKRYPHVRKMDKDGDGAVVLKEVPAPMRKGAGAQGEARLVVSSRGLHMLRGGMLFLFDLKTLELLKSTQIEVKTSEEKSGMRGDTRE